MQKTAPNKDATTVLYVDKDETLFHIKSCIAKALTILGQVNLLYAKDIYQALVVMETAKPDVVVLESALEDKYIDLLEQPHNVPLIIIETEEPEKLKLNSVNRKVIYVLKSSNLEGIHQELLIVTSHCQKKQKEQPEASLH